MEVPVAPPRGTEGQQAVAGVSVWCPCVSGSVAPVMRWEGALG